MVSRFLYRKIHKRLRGNLVYVVVVAFFCSRFIESVAVVVVGGRVGVGVGVVERNKLIIIIN